MSLKNPMHTGRRQRGAAHRFQRGVAAVELAIILPFLVLMLALALLFGRTFWHYTVMQKAAHDSARYMASMKMSDMRSFTRVSQATDVAFDIVDEEMGDLHRESTPWSVTVQCDGISCDGLSTPQFVRVVIRMRMIDDILGGATGSRFGDGLLMTADVTMPYVGS